MNHKTLLLSVLLLFLFNVYCNGQKTIMKKMKRANYYDGIYKSSGKTLHAKLHYDASTNILWVKIGKTEIVPLTANTVEYFEINEENGKRNFYSLPVDVKDVNHKNLNFLEVIYQKNNIAILEYYTIIQKEPSSTSWTGADGNMYTSQTNNNKILNEIFLVKGSNGINEYLRREGGAISFFKVLDKTLLENFFALDLTKVKKYADANRLSFKSVKDLIEIMDYYASIKN